MDKYQERYQNHQERKTASLEKFEGTKKKEYTKEQLEVFKSILENRRSQRIFNDIPLTKTELEFIEEAVRLAPSSCNRQAVYIRYIDRDIAERLLVGGKRWINKADTVLLIFASAEAYKSPNEKGFMPFLDTGFVGQNIYLASEVLGIGCCFVNPNIREENKEEFVQMFGNDYFGGAVALGNYDVKSKRPPLRESIWE